jgi:hypothetical protein
MDARLWHGPSANKERHGDTADSPTLPKAISRMVSGGVGGPIGGFSVLAESAVLVYMAGI